MGTKLNTVVLDRDGVINYDSDNYIKSVSEWVPIDGSIEAIARLSISGYKIDGIFFCPHHPEENCDCRKPRTGLLRNAEKQLDSPLKNSFFVGDSYTDLQCAVNFGLTPILVRSGKGGITESRLRQERENEALQAELSDSPNKNFYLHQTKTYNDLAHFSRIILS